MQSFGGAIVAKAAVSVSVLASANESEQAPAVACIQIRTVSAVLCDTFAALLTRLGKGLCRQSQVVPGALPVHLSGLP